ncbi:hypothetical protein [Lacibacter sp.]|uniref:hypothetical protein n=1 Tax=Lacibacter sp. TaxID=1915409 RepID=UPI002B4B8625|nr:hypothetical protein [Lacibacter sp.]HLP38209.1 hypothetical protein [Lacibacter sp.]
MYNVLWFDDEHQSLTDIREKAHVNDVVLHGVSNAQDGIRLLKEKYMQYDAVIVDGLFYQNANQTGDVSKQDAFIEVARTLDTLKDQKSIPWFILSGQTTFTKGSNAVVDVYRNGKVYDKVSDKLKDDLSLLWSDLKREVDFLPETQILRNHKRAFAFFTDEYLGEKYAPVLLNAIKLCSNSIVTTEEIRNSFVPLRKIMEQLFRYLTEIGVIPEEVYSAAGSFNQSSIYLSGLHTVYKINEGLIPPVIGFLLKQVTQVTQDSAHDNPGKLKLAVDEFIHSNQTNYLYQSTVYQLLELLVWFKTFADEQKTKTDFAQSWQVISTAKESVSGEWQQGSITRIAPNGYGTFQPDDGSPSLSIIPKFVNEFALQEKDIILVATEESNDKQKLHIKAIKKI